MAEEPVTADSLPEDVLLAIFSYCSHHTLVTSIQHVCKRWQKVSRNRHLWRRIVYEPHQSDNTVDIVKTLKSSPKLQAVNLSFQNFVSEEVFRVLADHCPELRILHLSEFTYVDVALFKYLVKKCPDIEELTLPLLVYSDLHLLNIVTEFRHLKTIVVKATFVGSYESLNVIARNFPKLEHLELLGISIKKSDLLCLIKNKKDQLKSLRLSCTLCDGSCVLPHLSACTKLKTLFLDSLCESVPTLPPFKEVSTLAIHGGNFHSPLYCRSFFELFPQVTQMQLSFCKAFGDKIISIIAIHCQLIKKMAFGGGFFSDETLKTLPDIRNLTRLVVSWSGDVTNEGIESLIGFPELSSVTFYKCGLLTPACIETLASCPKLRIAEFQYCFGFIGVSQESVRDTLPRLRVYLIA